MPIKELIERAVKGGFDCEDFLITEDNIFFDVKDGKKNVCYVYTVDELIFSHDFLRAFHGEWESELERQKAGCEAWLTKWQFYGIKMFLSDDRLEYLRKFL